MGLGPALRPVLASDDIRRLVDALAGASSYKVRLEAAYVLARQKDSRVLPALAHAVTSDPNPLVRSVVLRLLAKNPGGDATDDRARAAIRRALNDSQPEVRAQAARSLAEMAAFGEEPTPRPPAARPRPGGSLLIAVRAMGDKTGRARPELRERMKSAVIGNLRSEPRVAVAEGMGTEVSYVVDGSIARLEHGPRPRDIVESTCAVELVVSRPPHGIVLVASGEASVQKARSQFRPVLREPMDAEALDYAVKSAHENLAKFFAHNR
jgi:hypothetical protein